MVVHAEQSGCVNTVVGGVGVRAQTALGGLGRGGV